MTTDSRTSLRPEVVDRIAGLELKARHIVEGYVSGLHRSPFRGFSVEFAEHREYVPGDDVRFLDWKVFGKTDRLYIKRYEEETNLEAWMVVDISGSMAYDDREAKLPSKLAYSTWGAAALAWLITRQRDAAGLVLFDDRIRLTLPAQANEAHLRSVLRELEAAQPSGATGFGRALREVAEAVRRRGLIVLFSDLLGDENEALAGLKHLRHRGHEVLLFHVLAHDEVTFPFQRLTRFEGLEGLPDRVADPVALRAAYLEEVRAFRRRLRRVCVANRIDLVEIDTQQELGVVLAAYLAQREARRGERR
ncbi:MAG: DUF58 domain-containing protein [Planctomycetes bacterium]|nr:DUF58 domain-containing protein [Planctomycetota bacterium]MCB9826048.1 DUF58 domain-containing protein [Planctomycetota bacterium]MCB9829196.1 DUF58 domain-containing protein [Planctomycetota bacterium]